MLHAQSSGSGAHAQKRFSRRFLSTTVVGAVAAAGLVSSIAGAMPAGATASTASCAAVHIIVARASTEAAGDGVIGALATLIQGDVNATVSQEAVVYPASLTNYASSVAKGDSAMAADVEKAVSSCPNEKIVLLGYSQGAQVVGDVLAGGGGGASLGAETAPIPSADAAQVIAAIQFGDPRHQPNLSPIDLGTDPGAQGIFPVQSGQSRAAFGAVLRSWCDTGDPFCAGGANLEAHLQYTQKYDTAANTFVKGRLSAAGIS
jgi:acetylxylan esterase